MSRRKSIQKEYKRKARLLKKHKLINYDLRHDLTPAQMAVITKKWSGRPDHDGEGHHGGFGHLIENNEVVKRHVSKKRARDLKRLGYPVHKQSVYINKRGYENVHIQHDRIIYREKGKQVADFLLQGNDILKTLERRFNRGIKKNQRITVRIGNYAPFSVSMTSYEDLHKYITKWQPSGGGVATREDLIDQMSIVTFDV